MHTSIKMETPCEFINITPLNPLISKCQIKVCYVGDEPNRNKSVITKEVAKQIANSLPGSPIVGYYNEVEGDFEEHNREISIANGKFRVKDGTRPYGFVDLGARCWFQKFLDDGVNEREYLMTEGYLWTGQYPETQRIIDKGNNQSMELDQDHLDAHWSKDVKGKPEFFIINEAIMSKLCILGEDVEPCFEGASISAIQFSFDDSFKADWANMMNQMKEILKNEGGAPVFKYTVNSTPDKTPIENYLANQEDKYDLVECYKEGDQEFAVLHKDNSFFRMNYSFNGDEFVAEAPTPTEYSKDWGYDVIREINIVEASSTTCQEDGKCVTESMRVTTEHSVDVSGPRDEYDETIDEDPVVQGEPVVEEFSENSEHNEQTGEFALEEEPPVAETVEEVIETDVEKGSAEPVEEPVVEEAVEEVIEEPAQAQFAIDETAYNELQDRLAEAETNYSSALGTITELNNVRKSLETQFAELQAKYEALETANTELKNKLNSLNEFKLTVEREKKMELIGKFYMLNDEDKKDVIANVDNYSLDDIEAKLCVACFRNHVSFNEVENEQPVQVENPIVYNLNSDNDGEDLTVPAWVKAVRATQKNLDN